MPYCMSYGDLELDSLQCTDRAGGRAMMIVNLEQVSKKVSKIYSKADEKL